MTVGEVRKICDGEPIQLIGSRTGKKLVNIVHNGGYFAAVLERDKILNGEENE